MTQPTNPLDYAPTPPRRRKIWVVLIIAGAAMAGLFVVAFLGVHMSVSRTSPRPVVTQATGTPTMMVVFQDDSIPKDLTPALTGGGGPASWAIVKDGDRKVLAQTSADPTESRFPLCLLNGLLAKNVEVATDFKTISGKIDQAAGLIVRYQDKDNYYVARANALENNVRLYKVIAGAPTQLGAADAKVKSGDWHRLRLNVSGTHFKVLYEDKLLFEADDPTIVNAGQVGFWTKSDSATEFDLLIVSQNDKTAR